MSKARTRRQVVPPPRSQPGGNPGTLRAAPSRPGRWAPESRGPIWLAALSVAGIGVATYLTFVHYANVPVFCSSTGFIDCQRVVSSAYSVVPGTQLPITVPGILFFVVSLGLSLGQYLRPEEPALRRAHFALAGLGMIAALYLIFCELVELKTICLYCTGVHLLIFATLLTTAWRMQGTSLLPERRLA